MSITTLLNRGSKLMSRKRIAPFIAQMASNIAPGSDVLNVGASGGYSEIILDAARRNKFTVTSSDIDADRRPDIVDDICCSKIPDRSFDVIVIADVLEHVLDPQKAAEEILRLLRPGGYAIITVPFLYPIHDRPHDYHRWTSYGARLLLKDFVDVEMQNRDNWMQALLVMASRVTRETGATGRIAGVFVIPAALVLFPIATRLARDSDFLTTGYMIKAWKAV